MNARLRRLGAITAVVLVTFVLAACTGSEPADTPDTSPIVGTVVDVSAKEYSYTLSTTDIPAGEVSFVLANDGAMEHDLVIEGVSGGSTPIINPGDTAVLFLTLEAGTYTLYCSVGNHRAQGMEIQITVG